MTRMDGFANKNAHTFLIKKMKTNSYDNPTMVHEVQSDFVCLKENFGINSKMFRSDASVSVEMPKMFRSEAPKVKYECEFDEWSPNESMR